MADGRLNVKFVAWASALRETFGRLFFAGFYWLCSALIAAGIAGAIEGVSGGGIAGIEAVSGLLARRACSLRAAGQSWEHEPAPTPDRAGRR